MNIWRKISNWESNIEKAPKSDFIRLLLLIFSFSVIFGAFISYSFTSFQARAITKIEKDIRQMEVVRMNLLVKSIENNTYNK